MFNVLVKAIEFQRSHWNLGFRAQFSSYPDPWTNPSGKERVLNNGLIFFFFLVVCFLAPNRKWTIPKHFMLHFSLGKCTFLGITWPNILSTLWSAQSTNYALRALLEGHHIQLNPPKITHQLNSQGLASFQQHLLISKKRAITSP